MTIELDYDLTPHQWESLKALRNPAPKRTVLNRVILDQLMALGLAAMSDGVPSITPSGRKVLIRGSSRLWDVAA
jgi:hypothetical protein